MTDHHPHRDYIVAGSGISGWLRRVRPKLSWWWAAPPVAMVAVVAYVAGGMLSAHVIDDAPDFGPGTVTAHQSRAVSMAARLILREVDEHSWVANDPFFLPSWWLDNMPNFQQGIIGAIGMFTQQTAAISDRGQGPAVELVRASGLLKYPGTVWKFDPSTSWAPTASSEKQYRTAARNLAEYNLHQEEETTPSDRRAEDLARLIRAIGDDLARSAAGISLHLDENHWALLDSTADDVFYEVKGRAYAYSLLLREIGWDYAGVLSQRDLGGQWRDMLDCLRRAAALDPPMVINGAPDATILPNHLTNQGFFLLRARADLAALDTALGQ